MNTYFDDRGHLRNFPWIKAEELGPVREHLFFYKSEGAKTSRQFRNRKSNRDTEIFISIELRNGTRKHGWLTRNETTDRFTDTLFQDRRQNQHIRFVEWETPSLINCVVEDGIYISQSHFFMTKEELEKFLEKWAPAEQDTVKS